MLTRREFIGAAAAVAAVAAFPAIRIGRAAETPLKKIVVLMQEKPGQRSPGSGTCLYYWALALIERTFGLKPLTSRDAVGRRGGRGDHGSRARGGSIRAPRLMA